ncbi:MAG: methyltransferase domain-containing protein [Rhizobiaceae bacterium]
MQANLTSGNLTADKRADYARMLSEAGDFQAASDLMRQTLELVPDWAAGWFQFAGYLERANDPKSAAIACRKVLELAPADRFGARLKLSLLEGQSIPDMAQTAYVEALFDDYADRFDHALLQKLDYRVPSLLAAMISVHCGDRIFSHAIDLGCGTGLMAQALTRQPTEMTGIDLSAAMLERARAKGLYKSLIKADLVEGMMQLGTADLILAADVLMYLPSLDTVFDQVAVQLKPGGLFAFSVERLEGQERFCLRPSLRHAHSEPYIRSLLAGRGLSLVDTRIEIIRRDGIEAITGQLYLAAKTAHG